VKHYALHIALLAVCLVQGILLADATRTRTRCELDLLISLHGAERCIGVVETCLGALERDPVLTAARRLANSDVDNPCAPDGDTDHDCVAR